MVYSHRPFYPDPKKYSGGQLVVLQKAEKLWDDFEESHSFEEFGDDTGLAYGREFIRILYNSFSQDEFAFVCEVGDIWDPDFISSLSSAN